MCRFRQPAHARRAQLAAVLFIASAALVGPARSASVNKTVCDSVAFAQAGQASMLIDRLARTAKQGNVIVSPASLAGAFNTLSAGANEPMRTAMVAALGQKPYVTCAQPFFAAIGSALGDLAESTPDSVQMANRLILDPSVKLGPLLLQGLTAQEREIVVDDLSRLEGIARANDWVKDKTQGRVPVILRRPLDNPVLAALNALHFKASWQHRFDPALTKAHSFQGVDGTTRDVMLMQLREGTYAFRTDKGFTAVNLPFAGERLSLTLVTTTGKPASASAFGKATSFLDGTRYDVRAGDVALPRLKLSADNDLLPALSGLGLDKAGHDALGGFGKDIRLSAVFQRIEMVADENGAEAAATTAALAQMPSPPRKPVRLVHVVLDKPFVFALRDRASGLILIAGYVAHPGEIAESSARAGDIQPLSQPFR